MPREIRPLDEADADYIFVKNVSGSDLEAGTAVMATVAGDDDDHEGGLTVIVATVADETRALGLVVGRTRDDSGVAIPDDGFGYVVRRGVCPVAVPVEDSVAVSEGDEIVLSGVDAGEVTAEGTASAGTRVLAVALEAAASDVIPANGVLVRSL